MRALVEIILLRRGVRAGGGRLTGMLVALLLGLSALSASAVAQPSYDVREEVRDEPVQAKPARCCRSMDASSSTPASARCGCRRSRRKAGIPIRRANGSRPNNMAGTTTTRRRGARSCTTMAAGSGISRSAGPGIPVLQFSPGWVVWRSSPEWTGWAPMPPDQAFQNISSDQFNNSDQWIFVETAKFNAGCDATQIGSGRTHSGDAAPDQMDHGGTNSSTASSSSCCRLT